MCLVLFIKLCFILSFVNYVRCEDSVKNSYIILIIIIFITLVCTLSVVALLYGFKRGRESVRRESLKEEENEENLNLQENSKSKKSSDKVSNVRQNNVNTDTNESEGSGVGRQSNDSIQTIRSKSDEEMGAEVRDKQNLSL